MSNLASALAELGDEVLVLAHKPNKASGPSIPVEGPRLSVRLASVYYSERFRAALSLEVRSVLKEAMAEFKPEIVHVHGAWMQIHFEAVRIASRVGVPVVTSPRGMLQSWSFSHHAFKKWLAWRAYQRRTCQRSTVFHATSPQEAADLRGLVPDKPVFVVPNGVDFPGVMPAAEPGRPDQVLYLGRIHPVKALDILLRAWRSVRARGWNLVIVGPDEGGHRGALEELSRRLGLEGRVRFHGEVSENEKWGLLRNARVFVLPSQTENFGIAVAEALAAGLPVIATKGTPWEGLPKHGCGWWVECSENALATALQDAVGKGAGDLERMGSRGRDWAEVEFSWKSIAQRMRQVYSWLGGNGKQPEFVT